MATNEIEVEFESYQTLTGEGVPRGGNKGQVLLKNSDKDYDTIWGESGSNGGGDHENRISTLEQDVDGIKGELPDVIARLNDCVTHAQFAPTVVTVDEHAARLTALENSSSGGGSSIILKSFDLSDEAVHYLGEGIEDGAYEIEIWSITNGGDIIQPFNLILMGGMTYGVDLIQVRFHAYKNIGDIFKMYDKPTCVAKIEGEIVYTMLNGNYAHEMDAKIGVQVPTINEDAPSTMAKVYVKYTKMEVL